MSCSSLNSDLLDEVLALVLMKINHLANNELVKVVNAVELIWCLHERNFVELISYVSKYAY